MRIAAGLACATLALAGALALAAPDERLLGRDRGYPVGKAARGPGNWYFDESVRVGSCTHQAQIPGLFGGRAQVLAPAGRPMALAVAAREPTYRWDLPGARALTVDDFLARQRIMGLLIVKDGVIQVERYQYGRTRQDLFTSNSMAKSITALGIGIALRERRIRSLDDRAEIYAPGLRGSLYGGTSLRNLLRMSAGARYDQRTDWSGDTARFGAAIGRVGVERAARQFTVRQAADGTRFHYATVQTGVLGAALRGATGQSLSDYLTPRLWQAIGAEHAATWRADSTGLEVAFGNFNATLRDYARLGVVLANDGARPDLPGARPVVPREFLLEATDARRLAPPFRPRKATPYMGYGYQFWLLPGPRRRFAMLGSFGQSIFVDPALRLVIVQVAANRTSNAGDSTLGNERLAFWRGVVRRYGEW